MIAFLSSLSYEVYFAIALASFLLGLLTKSYALTGIGIAFAFIGAMLLGGF